MFWEQGDFGYIKKMKDQVLELCLPKEKVYIVDVNIIIIIIIIWEIFSIVSLARRPQETTAWAYDMEERPRISLYFANGCCTCVARPIQDCFSKKF